MIQRRNARLARPTAQPQDDDVISNDVSGTIEEVAVEMQHQHFTVGGGAEGGCDLRSLELEC